MQEVLSNAVDFTFSVWGRGRGDMIDVGVEQKLSQCESQEQVEDIHGVNFPTDNERDSQYTKDRLHASCMRRA